ncbi:MAG TPA: kelch repeat-containing protein, partial [Candidatus Udaeobacter sp.]|nr:kelch repeat-containing protein [Candidatus Udaeobacter sp.]
MQTTPKANNILGHLFALFGLLVMLAIATWVSASSSEQVKPLDNLATPRTGHTATALADGRILITGGRDADGHLVAASEIFDPESQTSTTSATLHTARVDHTATVLVDGRVLVTGGTGDSGALASAEIFDPAHPENGFTTVGSAMSTARAKHTATLLNSGLVLLAGGDAQGSAELFDATTGTFMPTIWPLTVARSGHTATLFSDDTVLLAGGNTSSMETFTPNVGFTLDPATMSVVRTGHWAFELSDTRLLLFQGDTGNTIDEFNPSTGTITPKGSLDFHASSSSLLANGKVLVLGTAVSGLYDPNAVPPAPDFTAFDENTVPNSGALPRSGQAAVELPGDKKILISGGVDGDNHLLGQALYNPARIWTDKDDYQPDEPVVLSGSGWQANEPVYLFAVDNETEQWTYEMTVNADANGEFVLSPYFIVELRHLGVQFHVSAVGQSTMQADVYFTDSNPDQITLVGSQAPNPVAHGNAVTYGTVGNSVKVTFNGNNTACSVTLSASPLPSGATATFSPNPVSGQGGDTKDVLLTISTSAAVPNGAYTFNINGASGTGCQGGATPKPFNNAALVVGAQTTSMSVNPATGTYGGNVSVSATLTSGSSGVSGKNVVFSLNGNNLGTGITNASGVATLTLDLCAPVKINAGSYPTGVAASFAGDSSFGASNATNSLTINKANATVTVTPYNVTYDGSPHTSTVTLSGSCSDTAAQIGTVNVSGTTHTNAGTYNDSWSFTGSANYNDILATPIINVIDKANPTATLGVSNSPQTYNGSPQSANVVVVMSSVPGTIANVKYNGSGVAPTNAASYTVTADFVPNDTTNYNTLTNQSAGSFVINKANAVINVTPYNVTYNCNAHTATGTATGVNSENLSSLLDLSGTIHTNAGDYLSDAWTFNSGNANPNYNNASGTVHDQIG